jgi:hypothetical protein
MSVEGNELRLSPGERIRGVDMLPTLLELCRTGNRVAPWTTMVLTCILGTYNESARSVSGHIRSGNTSRAVLSTLRGRTIIALAAKIIA